METINNDTEGMEIIIIPEHIAATIFDKNECAFVGRESESDSTEPEALCCDAGATSSLSSSFLNCSEISERAVPIQTAQGGTVMMTTHVCIKTYFVRDRTGELRPLSTKTFIVKNLKHDILSGKALNKAGYRVTYDPDPEESGVYAILDGKTCKSRSFPFMNDSDHTNLFYLKTEPLSVQQFGRMSGYELWHRRLGHCSNRNIRDTIHHSAGLEELMSRKFDPHMKCPSCMIGKSTLEDLPKLKDRAEEPLAQVNMDSFSSSVPSIEGYNHAVVFVDCNSGYRWLYGMKLKSDMLGVVKKWYSDIADLRLKHKLTVVMRDNAGEHKSQAIVDFFESVGVKNYYSTSYEQWQNGLAEAAINSIMMISRTVMVESGLGGRFWFKSALAAVEARNATYKERIGTTPWRRMHGERRDVSRFRAFGCRAWVHLNSERREKGKHTPRAVEAIYLGFEPNTSAYSFFITEKNTIMSSNQAQFDEGVFPFRKKKVVEQYQSDNSTDILYRNPSDVKWIPYNKLHVSNYTGVHYDSTSDVMVMRVNTENNSYTRVTQKQWLMDKLDLTKAIFEEQQANFAGVTHRTLKGLPPSINPDRPPKNYKDAMSREDRQEWGEAFTKEYRGFVERGAFKAVRPRPGVKVHDTLTRFEYKDDNGTFLKRKVRLCARGDQQIEGESFNASDLYAPTLKAPEARLLAAIAAEHGCPLLKTDTRQAFLYGEMGEDEEVYIRPPDWWPEPVPEGHVLLLLKSMYGTKQAARRWHIRISDWMEQNGYPAVNSEKTIFMKRQGSEFIIHGLFVDDMMHVPTCDKLRDEFLELYQRDFEITGGGLMETFLGMEVEQPGKVIRMHLDTYIQTVLDEYKEYIKKALRTKRVPMSPGIVLNNEDCPDLPDPRKQKYFRSFIAKLQFAASWVRFDISYTVSSLARFCAYAGPSHWAALHHLMEYLAGFPSFKLTYRKRSGEDDGLSGFADSDWGNSSSRRSTSGNLCLYNRCPILWRSKMQKTTALSTAEAEYYSASTAATEVLYLRNLLENMGFAQQGPTPVYEDNTACIEWGNHVIGGRERAKHIDIRKHFAHEVIQNGKMKLIHVSTVSQLADILTKPLHFPQWQACVAGILNKKVATT